MASTSRIKNSFQPGKVPTLQDIGPGDIGVNNYDGKLYIRKKSGNQVSIVSVGNEAYITPDNVALTGEPTAPTASLETNSEQIATTAFVRDVVLDYAPSKTGEGATGLWDISITGNAASASILAGSPRINGVVFNGSADITLPASSSAALTAGSFLVSDGAYDGSAARTFSVDASAGNNSNKLVARDAVGNFSAGTITATLNGVASSALTAVTATSAGRIMDTNGNVVIDTFFIGGSSNDINIRPVSGAVRLWNNTGSNYWSIVRPTVTSNRTLTLADGDTVLVPGTMLTAGSGTISNADISATAAIEDTKLATIAATGKVSNSATTADSANTPSAIVARDASGNFAAGTITAALTGTASGNLPLSGGTLTGVLQLVAGTAAAPAVGVGEANTGLFRPSAGVLAVTTSGTEAFRVDASGRIGFGVTTTLGGTTGSYRFGAGITGGTSANGLVVAPTIATDVTTFAACCQMRPTTALGISGLAELAYYATDQGTLTGGSPARGTVVNQYGFYATGLNAATNNYGFYANLAGATGRWSFYAAGSAPSSFDGDIRCSVISSNTTAPAASNSTATASVSSLRSGLRSGTPTAAIDLLVPTAANLDAGFIGLAANQAFEWSLINLKAPLSGTYSQTGTTTITVTATAHGLSNGSSISLDFTTGTAQDGLYTVAGVTANTFTVTSAVSATTSGNVTLQYTITVASNTDHSVIGNMVVSGSTSARFLTRKDAVTPTVTFVTYRIA